MTAKSIEKVFTRKENEGETSAETGPEGRQTALWPYTDYESVRNMPLGYIVRWDKNPRRDFDPAAMSELAASIQSQGVQQPIVVRVLTEPLPGNPAARVQIVMGERRWRAAQMAELPTMPCVVRVGLSDRDALALAVIENYQRSDLNAMEEAQSYAALKAEGLSQVEIARLVGISESTLSNALRLLKLPESVQVMVSDGRLQASHARALMRFEGFDEAIQFIAQKVIEDSVSARSLESSVPFFHEMDAKKIVRAFSAGNLSFDLETNCKVCPYGAYRTTDNWAHVCLKPEHYKQLEREADQARQNRLAALYEQRAKEQAEADAKDGIATGVEPSARIAGEIAPEWAEAFQQGAELTRPDVREFLRPLSPKPDAAVLKKGDLQYGEYENVESRPPDGCSPQCQCRAQMVGYNGAISPICTNPKRYQQLKAAQTKRDNVTRKAEHTRLWKEFVARRSQARELFATTDTRGLVLLLYPALQSTPVEIRRDVMQHLGIDTALDPGVNKYMSGNGDLAIWESLATQLSPRQLIDFALLCLMAREIARAYENRYSKIDSLEWYMERAEIPDAPTELVPIPGGEYEYTNDGETDFCCARCSEEIADDLLGSPITEQKTYAEDEDGFAWQSLRLESKLLIFDTNNCTAEEAAENPELVYCPVCAPLVAICRVCGCTNERGCDAGCEWVLSDLCSQCIDRAAPTATPTPEESAPFAAGQRVATLLICDNGSLNKEGRACGRDAF